MKASALDHSLAALADPVRRRAIDLLRRRPRRPSELARALKVSAPVMSRHLRLLRTGGFIQEDRGDPRDSRLRIYRLRRKPFADLHGWIQKVETFWTEQLDAFKAHAERSRRHAGSQRHT